MPRSLREGQGRAFQAAGPACLKTEQATWGQGADLTIRAVGPWEGPLTSLRLFVIICKLGIVSNLQDTQEDLII